MQDADLDGIGGDRRLRYETGSGKSDGDGRGFDEIATLHEVPLSMDVCGQTVSKETVQSLHSEGRAMQRIASAKSPQSTVPAGLSLKLRGLVKWHLLKSQAHHIG
jgi:hypothetical protein